MPHDAPVNTVPTQSAGALSPSIVATVVFDVADLQRSIRFYNEILGFRVASIERAGLPYETAVMVSDRYPSVALFARKTFQRPVIGSLVGSVIQIGLRDPSLTDFAAQLNGRVTWMLPPAASPATDASGSVSNVTRVSFLDPDGYVVELFC